MSRSDELWDVIEKQIADENIIESGQLQSIRQPILAGTVTADDWTLVIENTLLKDDDNAG